MGLILPPTGEENRLNPQVLVITDGKIGDDVQCRAVAARLDPNFRRKVVSPRSLWASAAPWGPVDPLDWRGATDCGFPDIAIASGRRSAPFARALRRASGGRTMLAFLKDPRLAPGAADFIWAPEHDQLSGETVFSTLTSPHDLDLSKTRATPNPAIARLTKPLLGVVVGGGRAFDHASIAALASGVASASIDYESVAVTPSRRTQPAIVDALREALGERAFIWDGTGDNPYADILACADTLIITADSHNMTSEALASEAGAYLFRPARLQRKLAWFADQLQEKGLVKPLQSAAPPYSSPPVNATGAIVDALRARYQIFVDQARRIGSSG